MKSLYKVEKLKKLGEVEGKGGLAECLRFPLYYNEELDKMIASSAPLWTLQVTNCFVSCIFTEEKTLLHLSRRI